MQNPILIEMMRAMGGTGIPIAFDELHSAQQTGVVDGAENNLGVRKQFDAKYSKLLAHIEVLP